MPSSARVLSNQASPYQDTTQPFKPMIFFFFYGTLMDPDVLRAITLLDTDPILRPATLTGFDMKLWAGRYPILLPAESGRDTVPIKGMIWQATSLEQCLRLQRYETSAYEPCECVVEIEDGTIEEVVTFRWARDRGSEELESLEG